MVGVGNEELAVAQLEIRVVGSEESHGRRAVVRLVARCEQVVDIVRQHEPGFLPRRLVAADRHLDGIVGPSILHDLDRSVEERGDVAVAGARVEPEVVADHVEPAVRVHGERSVEGRP